MIIIIINKDAIDKIKIIFENGKSVNSYLSDKHNKNYKFKDKLFHLLGIHHLHLSLNKDLYGKIVRSDYLFLLQIDELKNMVYFLDIVLHRDSIDYYKCASILGDAGLLSSKYLTPLHNIPVPTNKLGFSKPFSSSDFKKLFILD